MRRWTYALILLSFLIGGSSRVRAEVADRTEGISAAQYSEMTGRLAQAWARTLAVYYDPKTHLFYATPPARVAPASAFTNGRLDPDKNKAGYGAGMEDCDIFGGLVLSMLADQYEVTHDASLTAWAHNTFLGLKLCATVHGVPGFVARGVCAEDGRSICITSSRDQYTHFVHGLWSYYHSPLCDEPTKARIRVILSVIADRMTRTVTPANDYDSLRLDGSRDTRGISRMWNVMGHEAARLPMIYAAAWDATGRSGYRDLWRRYVGPAVDQSQTVDERRMPTYAWLQMQASLELLLALENDEALKIKIARVMASVSRHCAARAKEVDRASAGLDLTALCTDWRTGEGLSMKGGYRKVWYNIRESGEATLAELMDAGTPFSDEQTALLAKAFLRLDMDQVSSNGIYSLQAAYWKARRRGLFGGG